MKTIEEVLALENYPLSNAKLLPGSPGVYFCVSNEEIVYIGSSSNNINKRWKAHHKVIELIAYVDIKIYVLQLSNEQNILDLEYELINFWNPPLNKLKTRITVDLENPVITEVSNSGFDLMRKINNISPIAWHVFVSLVLGAINTKGCISIKQEELAIQLEVSRRSIVSSIKTLVEFEAIFAEKVDSHKYTYQVNPKYVRYVKNIK